MEGGEYVLMLMCEYRINVFIKLAVFCLSFFVIFRYFESLKV